MTSNPLARRQSAQTAPSYHIGRTPQEEADRRNAQLARNDIEWAVGSNDQLYLRDKPDWTSRRTLELEQQAERDRQIWKQAQKGSE